VKAHKPRLVLADDHRLLVEALRAMLTRKFDVVGTAGDGEELLALLRSTPADCLLLDLSLPGRSGLDLLPDIHAVRPDLRVVILTMHVDRILAEAAFAGGALGFVPKDSGMDEVEKALTEVLAGRRYLSPSVPKITHRLGMDAAHQAISRLTPRQQEILGFLADGLSSQEIADRIGLSANSVTFHRSRLRKVLGLESEFELVRYAILMRLAATEEEAGKEDGGGRPHPD
jgi:DNA-binding NarL/FixJ family response regulator